MFSNAIIRKPGKSFENGLTSADLGAPDLELALVQHQSYQNALADCGLDVTVLPKDEDFPDSTFVEDTALLTPDCAVITNPGAPSRKGEIVKIREIISEFYSEIMEIKDPGRLDAGDILTVGNHHYIGLSKRSNREGADQLIRILNQFGMTGSVIEIDKILHLKTGVSYLQNNNLVVCSELEHKSEFNNFHKIVVSEKEAYAANCVWINEYVLVPAGYPTTTQKISELGYPVIELEMSEFQKMDGGLSCLSLRF
ncbi:dimethylarginine dimethylaminohydrolase family protein [Rhodohalobacter sulfatireducens]|uniref:Arginine deiminase family protein n=1 Tax=Rhodohalobacter sulfatireducens TaxID=2911366 RepID=A0ABS9KFT8_9BACT|nr:arginine deiminase family protein [Rhodohalobacter sulfatireducens]MCG2589713.1 arginine deiminase family protein [Rhodohalobacter sulfatireducens]